MTRRTVAAVDHGGTRRRRALPSFWNTVEEIKTQMDCYFGASTKQLIYLTSSRMSLRR
jgi:hypothetical protein